MLTKELAGAPNNLEAFWMPFTANRDFKARPRLLVGAEGMHYVLSDGRRIIDGTAGLWCCNAGHGRPRIVEAIRQQAQEMDFAPTFQWGHPKAFELASRLAAMMPGELDHAFFTNSGSESVDTALKIAIAYQRAIGQGTRTRLIGRERGYHGVGFGGISVGGIVKNRMYLRLAAERRRPPAVHLRAGAAALVARAAGLGCASGGRAAAAHQPARCLDHRRRDRGAGGVLDRACWCRPWAISSGCGRSPRRTASCSSSTR